MLWGVLYVRAVYCVLCRCMLGRCTVCYGGVLYVMLCTVWYVGILCVRAVYCMLWWCAVW